MAGTSTIPTIVAGETAYEVTISWVDENNKEFSDSMRTKASPSDAEIQALVTDSQAGSNASAYKISTTVIWEGAKNKSNAASAVHESVADKVRYSLKDISSGGYIQTYMPAPLEVWVDTNNEVDITQATYIAWKAAVDAIKPTTHTPLNVEFVQYSQRNNAGSP